MDSEEVEESQKSRDEMPGEDEELVEMEVERALKHMVTNINTTMYCPNCHACITKVSIRKEKNLLPETPDMSKCFSFFSLCIPSDKTEDTDSKSKNSTIQNSDEEEEDEKSQTHSFTSLQKERAEMLEEEKLVELELERAVKHIDTHCNTTMCCRNCTMRITKVLARSKKVIIPPSPDVSGILSCFSLFIPSGQGFKLFHPFGAKQDKTEVANSIWFSSIFTPLGEGEAIPSGSKEEAFFNSQAWIDSDCEDDFVDGDNCAEQSSQCDSEEYEELHRDVLIRTLGGKGNTEKQNKGEFNITFLLDYLEKSSQTDRGLEIPNEHYFGSIFGHKKGLILVRVSV